ncbi:MAG: LysR family transcriptional regulator [Deltaproteobacteria bacterium]|nr:LysR family transcriptional regulator [Deltaproteobacteria bacterium]
MDRHELLTQIWNWLPAFRAVAETQHLPTASTRLHVTASALSRTIALIEDRVGQPLFTRSGRNILLNQAGVMLLESVKRAERAIDEGLGNLSGDPMAGPVYLSTLGVFSNHYVLPVLLDLKKAHPSLLPVISVLRASEANEGLSRGQLDLAFYYDAVQRDGLAISEIGEATNAVYCGRSHPLFNARQPTKKQILACEFAVPKIGDRGLPMDTWPVELPRKVGIRIEMLWTNLEVCLSGQCISVLPDVIAHDHWKTGALRRLPQIHVPSVALYAATRDNESPDGRAGRIHAAVKVNIAETNARLNKTFKASRV